MSLAGIAKANQEIVDRGGYRSPSRRTAARAGQTSIEVTGERTGEAARRVALENGAARARLRLGEEPGRRLRARRARPEEDLARCSALYFTQLAQPGYHEANRAHDSLLYTDHMIYSPSVPFFRDESHVLLESPVAVSVVTAPAPNAGEFLRRQPGAEPVVEAALRRRAGVVLALAEHRGDRHLVPGAWGCGVFRNSPALVADAFAHWLDSPRFAGAFARAVFAVFDRSPARETLRAFQRRLGGD